MHPKKSGTLCHKASLYIYNYQLPFLGESLYKSRITYDASESMTYIGTVFATASEFFEKNYASHFIYELQAAKVRLASGTDLRARHAFSVRALAFMRLQYSAAAYDIYILYTVKKLTIGKGFSRDEVRVIC